jgi:hypothetical protein
MSEMLTEEQADFLRRVRSGYGLPLADRKQDRLRQALRRNPRRWMITAQGNTALGESE